VKDTTVIILAVVAAFTLYGMRREIVEWSEELLAISVLVAMAVGLAIGGLALLLFKAILDGVRDLFRRKR
jgi:hypothetical protein